MTTSIRATELIVNPDVCVQIADTLKAQDMTNTSLHRALDHALDDLRAGRAFELRGNALHTQSSRLDWQFYDCTLDTCECEAQRGVCRHRAKLAILLCYQTMQAAALACVPLQPVPAAPVRRARVARPRVDWTPRPRPTPMSNEEYARVCALADELF